MNHLKCYKCLKNLPLESFSKKNGCSRGYSYKCKNCHNDYSREIWYKKNSQRQIEASKRYKTKNYLKILSFKYKIPIDLIEEKIRFSNKKCEICFRECKLVLDHCHKTGKIRGFICQSCNNIIGRAGDNLEGIMRFVEYLKK